MNVKKIASLVFLTSMAFAAGNAFCAADICAADKAIELNIHLDDESGFPAPIENFPRVVPTDTVGELKETIENLTGIHRADQEIMAHGITLSDFDNNTTLRQMSRDIGISLDNMRIVVLKKSLAEHRTHRGHRY